MRARGVLSHTARIGRLLLLLAAAAASLAAAGCGGGGAASSASPPVRLRVVAPRDLGVVRSGSVTVRGTVTPADARVLVRGRQAKVAGGAFSATVDLEGGVNVIDVVASAGEHARPALTAIRVRRLTTIAVPELLGLSKGDATAKLEGVGLKADVQQDGGGFFDGLFQPAPAVCSTDPSAGTEVPRGTTVTVHLARNC
jgi:hypothetical protein